MANSWSRAHGYKVTAPGRRDNPALSFGSRGRRHLERDRIELAQSIRRTPPVTDTTDWIAEHHRVWRKKAALRHYYERDIFDRIRAELRPGRTLELGAGPGFFEGLE